MSSLTIQELRAWFAGTEAQAQDEWLIRERSAVAVVGELVNTFRWLAVVVGLVVVLKSWMWWLATSTLHSDGKCREALMDRFTR